MPAPASSLNAERKARLFLQREKSAGERLPFARHLDDRTLETRDGLLIQVLHLEGFPFETADTEELNYRKHIRDTMLRGLASSRFSLLTHVVRRAADPSVEGAFDDPFCSGLDAAWRNRLATKRLYVNDLFLTLIRRPLQGQAGLFDSVMRGLNKASASARAVERARDRRELDAAREALSASLSAYRPRALSAYEGAQGIASEPGEFLSYLFNGELKPVTLPQSDLGEYLPYRRISFGRDALEWAPAGDSPRAFAAVLGLRDYPAHTEPGLFDNLLRLPAEMVLTQSFSFVERQVALDRMNLALRRMRAADDEALSLRAGLTTAKDDVAAGRAAFGEHHFSLLVKAASPAELDLGVAEALSALTEAGCVAVREDINLEPAFWAQFPGNARFIARRALVSSGNFSGLASFHNHPIGQRDNNHWGPAVTVLETTSAAPYYFNFHKSDLGNFTVIGPSGSGKTVVLGFLVAQAQKFKPRTIFFDKDRGAEIFIRALGGRYDVLRPGAPSGFNPLQLADIPANRRFLADWVAKLVTPGGEPLTVEDRAMIAEAVDANFAQKPEFRRLSFFQELFRGARRPHAGDLSARLQPWCGRGERAWLFDNPSDLVDLEARTIGFDMTRILDDATARTPAMMYLFHRVEERLDGTPSIIVIDEGWKALDDDVFVQRIKDWEKTIRKRNGIVGFCTQSASDALSSRIAASIIEQAATQIFMPNPKAQADEYCKGFGLTAHELDLVRSLPDTSRCFLIKHANDSVVARLNLNGLDDVLTVLSGREQTVRLLDDIRARVGEAPGAWMPELLAMAKGRAA
jgi:type IV secretion system protein VirB4